MFRPIVSMLEARVDEIEVVERKGLGHPDTICDALAETFSRNLCRLYLNRYGEILHHNVDKALLSGGRSAPAFGGGKVLSPISITLAGRVTDKVGTDKLPIAEVAMEGSRAWFRDNMHALDSSKHVTLTSRIGPGSSDLQALFSRNADKMPLANDTSIGVGYAPLSALERLVLEIDKKLHDGARSVHPSWGEDTKIMAVRQDHSVELTIACAMIGRHIPSLDAYRNEVGAIHELAEQLAHEYNFDPVANRVNAGDDVMHKQIYLTVTGTSAEAGDDGEVGRGNRANGLITPCRPMSLEAVAGKNPRTHVGKIYNVLARQICEQIVTEIAGVTAAQCLMVSRIGSPIAEPALVRVQIATADGLPIESFVPAIEDTVAENLRQISGLVAAFVAGKISIF